MKNKLTFSLKKIVLLICGIAAFSWQDAQAQSTVISALNSIRGSIDSIVNLAATYIFQTPPNVGNELVSNNSFHSAIQTVPPSVKNLNSQDIQNGLAPNTQNPNANLTTLATIQASDTVLSSITLGGLPIPFFSSAMQQNMQNALVQGNQNFNIQSLVNPMVYNSQDLQNFALNYIRFVSGWGVPISNLNLNSYPESQLSTKQKLNIQNSSDYQSYMVQRRQLIAQQSAPLTVLYSIYSRRLPITTLNAGDTGLGTPNPSAAQIEDYNATWRTSSPTWYTQMSTVSQTNVEREILFVLAEIQLQLHQLHQDNERLLALTAVGQLGNIQSAKQTLSLQEQKVQSIINQAIQGSAQAGTSTSTTTNGGTSQTQQSIQGLKGKAAEAEKQAETQAQQRLNQ